MSVNVQDDVDDETENDDIMREMSPSCESMYRSAKSPDGHAPTKLCLQKYSISTIGVHPSHSGQPLNGRTS